MNVLLQGGPRITLNSAWSPLEKGNQHLCPGSADHRVSARYDGSGAVLPTSGSQFGSATVSALIPVSAPESRSLAARNCRCTWRRKKRSRHRQNLGSAPRTTVRFAPCQTVRLRERLRNLIPIVLYGPVPKPPCHCLIAVAVVLFTIPRDLI